MTHIQPEQRKGFTKTQLIEFHDTGAIISVKDHSELVGWYPSYEWDSQASRINVKELYAKLMNNGVLSVLFCISGSDPKTIIEQRLTYKGNFTAWWGEDEWKDEDG